MAIIKCYLYDSAEESNGYRGTDYSAYVLQGVGLTEDLTQELDTGELTLVGLSAPTAFLPETKFIIDVVENEIIVSTVHFCVQEDLVEQPILSDGAYFNHHISFIEPSVVMQKRLVDNIAVTYKLKDVNLVEEVAYPTTTATMKLANAQKWTGDFGYGYKSPGIVTGGYCWWQIVKYFELEGDVKIISPDGTEYDAVYNNIDKFLTSDGTYKASFSVPKFRIMHGKSGTSGEYEFMGYASIDYLIEEYTLNNDVNPTAFWRGSFISNSDLSTNAISAVNGSNVFPLEVYNVSGTGFTGANGEYLAEDISVDSSYDSVYNPYRVSYRKYTDTTASESTYVTQQITLQADRKYKITLSLHTFDSSEYNLPTDVQTPAYSPYFQQWTGNVRQKLNTYMSSVGTLFDSSTQLRRGTYEKVDLPTNAISTSAKFVTYASTDGQLVYSSSVPYSALGLIQKAVLNSNIYEKPTNAYAGDLNARDSSGALVSAVPFYIDDSALNELAATQVIENFYNQKNLWEVVVEAFNYVHAIPEVKFGEDDRFIITATRLGQTDEKVSETTPVSIFNSHSVEDYVSQTSSYVSNMVQLGGYIEEWVPPKTTAETLLVSNDKANIIVSKPIIELLEIKVKCVSDDNSGITTTSGSDGDGIADLTPYIYEENVYKTLGLDYKVNPNRGIALYYQLGDNVIMGGDYQLPQANYNVYQDYAIKKCIYCAYNGYSVSETPSSSGLWTNLQVNNFIFYVKYRTKDSVRQNHTRPDLRKYLINSKYDRYPQHNQFNNQQDVVVDSEKFGRNLYGKLMRTGNNSYEKTEWCGDWAQVKHKGELYRINGDLYYVAQAQHTIYVDHITSKVTFSKDYNELSQVIGIPSEPRFYEISEQSMIRREVAISNYILLTDSSGQLSSENSYLFNLSHLADLVLSGGTDFAKYALTVFKGDADATAYFQATGQPDLYIETLHAVNAYASGNTLTYEWDCLDNYSAGDKVTDVDPSESATIDEKAYTSLWAVKYTDIYGKADLMDFYLLPDISGNFTAAQIKALPESPIKTLNNDTTDTRPFVGDSDIYATNVSSYTEDVHTQGIVLLKDCREAISLNYNVQMITSSDTFVLSPFVFLPYKSTISSEDTRLCVVLLSKEVNKLSAGYVDNSAIILPRTLRGLWMSSPYFFFDPVKHTKTVTWGGVEKEVVDYFYVQLSSLLINVNEGHFDGTVGYLRVKSIAILAGVPLDTGTSTGTTVLPGKTQFVIARNISSDWTKSTATKNWYFGVPSKEIYTNKQ